MHPGNESEGIRMGSSDPKTLAAARWFGYGRWDGLWATITGRGRLLSLDFVGINAAKYKRCDVTAGKCHAHEQRIMHRRLFEATPSVVTQN